MHDSMFTYMHTTISFIYYTYMRKEATPIDMEKVIT